jgi:mannose-6-phosphate isomerase-like protein (cupin superfamily)
LRRFDENHAAQRARQLAIVLFFVYESRNSVMTQATAINLEQKLSLFTGHWQPKIVGEFNGNDLMVVKVKGEFNWHKHDDTDDFFYVVKGNLTIQMRDGDVHLNPGEMYVVPKGVEHCPKADEECHILLIEPRGVPNTGDAKTAAVKTTI